MGGQWSKEAKLKRLLAKASEALKVDLTEVEEIYEESRSKETSDDFMREAQSVINFFESRTEGFTSKECKKCGDIFAYSWDCKGIAYCSISCAKRALADIGLKWNPDKPASERWGKTVPAVVSPAALEAIKEVASQVDQLQSTYQQSFHESNL